MAADGLGRGNPDLSSRRAEYVRRLEATLRQAVQTLQEVPGIRRISVFGSYAQGRRDLFTDLDLLVIWDTGKPVAERRAALYGLLAAPVDLDLLCYTPSEFAALREEPLLRRVASEEIVLYEAESV